ncbi:hypothetical protein [Hypericibacter terrae]|uniref:hypothetical protein n=1 Tax=Hypericibacter terrae TaxID=2602015 RepID=UPI001CD938BF|nr:hypothetical protein [Hypericibacter terrae]
MTSAVEVSIQAVLPVSMAPPWAQARGAISRRAAKAKATTLVLRPNGARLKASHLMTIPPLAKLDHPIGRLAVWLDHVVVNRYWQVQAMRQRGCASKARIGQIDDGEAATAHCTRCCGRAGA